MIRNILRQRAVLAAVVAAVLAVLGIALPAEQVAILTDALTSLAAGLTE
jgi:hypothetical protein